MQMIVLKNEIESAKEKALSINSEELNNCIDAHEIHESSAGSNDMLLWVTTTKDIVKRTKNTFRDFCHEEAALENKYVIANKEASSSTGTRNFGTKNTISISAQMMNAMICIT